MNAFQQFESIKELKKGLAVWSSICEINRHRFIVKSFRNYKRVLSIIDGKLKGVLLSKGKSIKIQMNETKRRLLKRWRYEFKKHYAGLEE